MSWYFAVLLRFSFGSMNLARALKALLTTTTGAAADPPVLYIVHLAAMVGILTERCLIWSAAVILHIL